MVRDTLLDWQQIAATEPWYGVLSDEKFLRANLTPEAIEEFYSRGVQEIREVVDRFIREFGDFRPPVAIDFGCGLGRLSFAMATYCEHVIGLDGSPAMLEEAERQRSRLGTNNVRFLPHLADEQRADWINSYMDFQHIDPKHGLVILDWLLSRLNMYGFYLKNPLILGLQLKSEKHAQFQMRSRFSCRTLYVVLASEPNLCAQRVSCHNRQLIHVI